jgi:hypothetical protein
MLDKVVEKLILWKRNKSSDVEKIKQEEKIINTVIKLKIAKDCPKKIKSVNELYCYNYPKNKNYISIKSYDILFRTLCNIGIPAKVSIIIPGYVPIFKKHIYERSNLSYTMVSLLNDLSDVNKSMYFSSTERSIVIILLGVNQK